MASAIYPGSFDPITFGHIDIIERAAKMFDHLIVSVTVNRNKTPLFSTEERVNMIKEAVKHIPNVTVDSCDDLLVNYAKECKVGTVVRGLRAVTDFDYELQMAQTNSILSNDEVDTVFLTTDLKYAYLSSTTVREVASYGDDISKFVPEHVAKAIYSKYKK